MNTSPTSKILATVVARTIHKRNTTEHADRCIHFDEWQWHQGVALHGLMQAHAVLGDAHSLAFVQEWVDNNIAAGNLPKSINTTAPLLAVAELNAISPSPKYAEVCNDYASWCVNHAPRLPDGTFEHSCTENSYPLQVWADTLFMGCIFLTKWGIASGQRNFVEESVKQFVSHYHYLHEPRTGLIYHGYDGAIQAQTGVLWGRGNGWFTAASVEVLENLPPGTPGYDTLLRNFQRHLEGVLVTQSKNGAWHTVMNEPSTYLEMSATAAFALGLRWAGRQTWGEARHRSAADRAYAVLAQEISPSGELLAASGGTPVMPTATDYNSVPYAVTGFAQGLAMLAFSRLLRETATTRPRVPATAALAG